MAKTVVVVGAGPSGLCAVKEMAEISVLKVQGHALF